MHHRSTVLMILLVGLIGFLVLQNQNVLSQLLCPIVPPGLPIDPGHHARHGWRWYNPALESAHFFYRASLVKPISASSFCDRYHFAARVGPCLHGALGWLSGFKDNRGIRQGAFPVQDLWVRR